MNHDPIALRFSNVAFSYENLPVLADVSFHFHQGEFIALVGPNGSGKTTLLKLILGLETASAGTVELLGELPRKSRSKIGYVPQHISYDPTFPIAVWEVVRMGMVGLSSRLGKGKGREEALKALAQVQLEDLADRPYNALSGGQRRRVLVARALVAHPSMLILDEPAANMDKESEDRLYDTLKVLKQDTTILIVTHDMSVVSALTDRVFCIGLHKQGCQARTVVQHMLEPMQGSDLEFYGEQSRRIRHDVQLSADVGDVEGGKPNA